MDGWMIGLNRRPLLLLLPYIISWEVNHSVEMLAMYVMFAAAL